MAENLLFTGFQFMADKLSGVYFGIPLVNYFYLLSAIIIGAVIGKVIVIVFRHHFAILAEKTSNKIDDLILDAFSKPLYYFIVLISAFIGIQLLGIADPFISNVVANLIITAFFILLIWLGFNLIEGTVKYYVKPFTEKTDSDMDDQILPIVTKVAKIGVATIFLIVILDSWDINVTAMIAGLGIGGLALAFAAQQTISDIFGGISIFTSRPFKVGHYVDINGTQGTVEEVGLRYTRLRTVEKRFVTIPNRDVAGSVIINYSHVPLKGFTIKLGLVYETTSVQLEKAQEILKEIIKTRKDVEPDPIVTFDSFGDFSLNIFFRYFVNDLSNWRQINHEIATEIKKRFDKEKLNFAFPTQTIHLEK